MNYRIVLRPICWLRTRVIWPYPVSGHSYVWNKQWKENGKIYEELRCELCGHKNIAWETL